MACWHVHACSVGIGDQGGEGPRNQAVCLASSFRLPKSARPPVIIPQADEFKLQTTAGFP